MLVAADSDIDRIALFRSSYLSRLLPLITQADDNLHDPPPTGLLGVGLGGDSSPRSGARTHAIG